MEKSEFSETQFVMGYTRELFNSIISPYLINAPSTSKEAQYASDLIIEYYGHRGHYRFSEFYQFKRSKFYSSEVYSSLNGKQHIDTSDKPKYGFNIYNSKKTRQFNVLQKLARVRRHHVYYCAPLFHTVNEFNNFFSLRTILDNSKLFDISQDKLQKANIKLNTNHKILFDRTEEFICSDPEKIDGIIASERPLNISKSEGSDYVSLEREIKELDSFISETISQFDIPRQNDKGVANVFSVKEELLLYFDIHWFPVFDKPVSDIPFILF